MVKENNFGCSDLRSVAASQKGVLICLVLYLASVILQFALPVDLRAPLLVAAAGVIIATTVFVFLLSTKVYSVGTGLLLSFLTLIPFLGLIALLIVNGKATRILKAHGIRVGLLGANSRDVARYEGGEEEAPRQRRREARRAPEGGASLVAVAAWVIGGVFTLFALVGVALWALYSAAIAHTALGGTYRSPKQESEGLQPSSMEAVRAGKFTMPRRSPARTSYVRAVSSQGDYIGQGKEYSYRGDQMTVRRIDRGIRVSVEGWDIWFGAPRGQFLSVGEYPGAKRFAFSGDSPGIEFGGNGRGCNRIAGQFAVWELEVRGEEVTRLAIDFVQRCEEKMPPLSGVIRFNSSFE